MVISFTYFDFDMRDGFPLFEYGVGSEYNPKAFGK